VGLCNGPWADDTIDDNVFDDGIEGSETVLVPKVTLLDVSVVVGGDETVGVLVCVACTVVARVSDVWDIDVDAGVDAGTAAGESEVSWWL